MSRLHKIDTLEQLALAKHAIRLDIEKTEFIINERLKQKSNILSQPQELITEGIRIASQMLIVAPKTSTVVKKEKIRKQQPAWAAYLPFIISGLTSFAITYFKQRKKNQVESSKASPQIDGDAQRASELKESKK